MEARDFYYSVYSIGNSQSPNAFRGCAFAVTPHGDLLTCRHVVDSLGEGNKLAVVPFGSLEVFTIENIEYPSDPNTDIALLPKVIRPPRPGFFPILVSKEITPGTRANAFGCFASGGALAEIEPAYFSGEIVSIRAPQNGDWVITLPFPILEGMSGSPLTRYHNGSKLVGLAFGNRSTRIVKSEVLEYRDTEKEYKESISRIIEFGLAYHAETIAKTLTELKVDGFVVSDKLERIPGLQ